MKNVEVSTSVTALHLVLALIPSIPFFILLGDLEKLPYGNIRDYIIDSIKKYNKTSSSFC